MSDFVARNRDEWELREWIADRDGTPFVEVEKVRRLRTRCYRK